MISLRIATKVLKLATRSEKDGPVLVSGYYVNEEKWETREIPGDIKEDGITKLLEVAAEYTVKERDSSEFLLVEVEAPGLRVVLGESGQLAASTVITPKPSYLRRMLFVKCVDSSNCKVVHEFKPSSQLMVYEGSIEVKDIDYDFIVVECGDHVRIVFPHELMQPRVKQKTPKSKRKRKKRKKRASKK